tara:strand:+ start:1016 stop:2656 length:1641 start_codon:yes stop_codon:yes gene_type:complete
LKEFLIKSIGFLRNASNEKPSIDYVKWREKWVELDEEKRSFFYEKLDTLISRPLFSVFISTDNTNLDSLFLTIESVKNQIYPDWILYLTSENQLDPDLCEKVSSFGDSRIKLGRFESFDVSDWFVGLDSTTRLHEAAFLSAVIAINENQGISIVYTDHDHIGHSRNFCDPHMKPAWNADLFAAMDYLSPLVFCEKELWKIWIDCKSDRHGFLLEATKGLSSSQIFHISSVLASVLTGYENSYLEPPVKRPIYDVPDPEPLVSILIPTRDQGRMLKKCLESLYEKTRYSNFEIVLVDHETSESKALKVIEEFELQENFEVVSFSGDFNFAAMINGAAEVANGDVFVLLNNDTEIFDAGWLKELVAQVSRPEIGIAGALLLFGDGTIQHAGIHPGIGGLMGHGHKHLSGDSSGYFNRLKAVHEVAAVTGACLAIEKTTWFDLNGLDEENLAVAYNDVDLCLKVRQKNLKVIFTPFSKLFHHESVSRGIDDAPERNARLQSEIQVMQERWGGMLNHDPAYSPNLSSDGGGFSLAEAPKKKFFGTQKRNF